jgi:hypothetical protein
MTDTSATDPIDPAGVPGAVPVAPAPAPAPEPEAVPDVPEVVPEPEVVEPAVVEPVAESVGQPEPSPVGHAIVQDNTSVPGVQSTQTPDGTVTSETAV